MTEQQKAQEFANLTKIVDGIRIGVHDSNNYDELNGYMGAIAKTQALVVKLAEQGAVAVEYCKIGLVILDLAQQEAKKKIETLEKSMPPQQRASVYDQIFAMIEQIANELEETTHKGGLYSSNEDGIHSLRKRLTQISEGLLDSRIRSRLSPEELANLEENIANINRSIGKSADLAGEIRERAGRM